MTIQFGYDKKQVLDGLRSHFFGRIEIRVLFIVINLFAILSAILFYFHKIQALSFLIFFVVMVPFMDHGKAYITLQYLQ